jgi:fibronectin-binding autotransporter adhesin
MPKLTVRTSLYTATALTGALFSQPAFADCVSQAPVNPNQIVCSNPGNNGWDGTATNNIVVTVTSGSTVSTSVGGAALINTGTGSAVINYGGLFNNGTGTTYGINAGSQTNPAISVGGGSIVTLDSGTAEQGTITFGNATGTTNNILNNNYAVIGGPADQEGAVTAAGNFTLNNKGFMGYYGTSDITQTGAGTVVINNGVAGGFAAPIQGINNSFIWGSINTQGSTTLNNLGGGVAASGNGTGLPAGDTGAVIRFNVTLGTLGTGTSVINNKGTIDGSVTMADKNNTVNNDGALKGNLTITGSGANVFNAGSTRTAGDNGLRLPGLNIITGVTTGTLQGSTVAGATNTLNLNGTGASTLQVGVNVLGFNTVNKNDAGSWLIQNTLDGTAGILTAVNVTGGSLATDNAAFLGSAATTVKLSNATTLNFNGTAAGTFAGNIVDATGATTGKVTVTGANATTLSGTNTYSGTTTIDGGTLSTGSNGALSASSDLTIQNGGTLNVNNAVAVKSLTDAGTGPNTVNLAAGTNLGLTAGTFGANFGTITGTGNLTKTGTGTFTLAGANTVNLAAPGTFAINDGTVAVTVANAIGATTAVTVNSTATTTGTLRLDASDTIGSLAGTGANAVVNLNGAGVVLDTGGLNTSTSFAGKLIGAGALVKTGTGAMTLTGSNTYAGGTAINGGSIIGYAGSTATNGSLQGNIAIASGASLLFDQTLSPNAGTSGTYAGALSGAGFVSFVGNGTGLLTLSGNNTALSGQMNFFNNSIVAISSANNVGTGALNFSNGTLKTTANMTLANAVTLSAPKGTFQTDPATTLTLTGGVSGAGQLVKTGTGTLILGAPSSYTGGTLVSGGILQGAAGSALQGNIVNNAQVNFTGITQTYTGNMSGTGNVKVINNAIIGFSGVNTYSGTTTIDLGSELYSFSPTALSPNSAFIVNGILAMNGTPTNTVGSLAGTGKVIATGTLSIGNDNTSTTFSGTFGSGGYFNTSSTNVTKIGTGTQTLTGAGSVLTGALRVNGGTLALGSTGTLSAATATVNTGGILSVDGSLTSPLVIIALGGHLIGGLGIVPGVITGAVTNSGTIAPGHSPGILNVVGSYTQTSTGTYAADVNGNGTTTVVAGVDFDRIAVSGTPGTASLAGTLAITQNGGVYVTGTTYDIFTTTGGISGAFTTVTGASVAGSAFQTLSNATANGGGIQGNNYRLVVTRANAYNTVATNPNQVAVANGLTGIIGSAGAAATTNKIDAMSAAQAQALFAGLNPEPYAAYATALQDQGELFTRQVGQRLAETGVADKSTGLWVNGYGQWANGKSRDFRFGSDHKIVGGAVGVDFGTEALRFGVAGGYSEDDVTYLGGNSKGKSKSYQVGGYMGYGAGPLHLDAQLAYISGDITATKSVNAGSGATLIQGTAGASTKGHLFKGIATVGYNLGGGNLTFEPFVGIDFVSGHINGFTEIGMGTLNLTVRDIEAKRTGLVVGARFAASTGSIRPYANVTYRYNVDDNPSVVTGYFNGVSTAPFTVSAIGSGRSAFDVDAGISAQIGTGASVFLGYQGTFRNDLDSHGVNGGLRFSF